MKIIVLFEISDNSEYSDSFYFPSHYYKYEDETSEEKVKNIISELRNKRDMNKKRLDELNTFIENADLEKEINEDFCKEYYACGSLADEEWKYKIEELENL